MRDTWQDRAQLMANLQAALTLANELEMGTLAYLIERALDEAQAAQFACQACGSEQRRSQAAARRLARSTSSRPSRHEKSLGRASGGR
jgi:hypothetical protein